MRNVFRMIWDGHVVFLFSVQLARSSFSQNTIFWLFCVHRVIFSIIYIHIYVVRYPE